MDAALTAPPPAASKMVESIKEKVQAVDTKGTILEKLIKEAKNTDQQETGYACQNAHHPAKDMRAYMMLPEPRGRRKFEKNGRNHFRILPHTHIFLFFLQRRASGTTIRPPCPPNAKKS